MPDQNKLIIALTVVLIVASCMGLPKPVEYDSHLTGREEGSITYLAYQKSWLSSRVGVRSVLQGENIDNLELQEALLQYDHGPGRVAWELDVHQSMSSSLDAVGTSLQHLLKLSSRLIDERNLTEGYKLSIRMSLVPQNVALDHFSTRSFSSRPRLHFVFPIDKRTHKDLAVSFTEALSVVHHELVHFASVFSGLEFPGDEQPLKRINEEIFAHLVQRCDRLKLLVDTDLAKLRISFPPPAAGFSGEMDKALAAARLVGPSAIGQVLADWFFLQPINSVGDPATEGELDQLRKNCDKQTLTPRDFMEIYGDDAGVSAQTPGISIPLMVSWSRRNSARASSMMA